MSTLVEEDIARRKLAQKLRERPIVLDEVEPTKAKQRNIYRLKNKRPRIQTSTNEHLAVFRGTATKVAELIREKKGKVSTEEKQAAAWMGLRESMNFDSFDPVVMLGLLDDAFVNYTNKHEDRVSERSGKVLDKSAEREGANVANSVVREFCEILNTKTVQDKTQMLESKLRLDGFKDEQIQELTSFVSGLLAKPATLAITSAPASDASPAFYPDSNPAPDASPAFYPDSAPASDAVPTPAVPWVTEDPIVQAVLQPETAQDFSLDAEAAHSPLEDWGFPFSPGADEGARAAGSAFEWQSP